MPSVKEVWDFLCRIAPPELTEAWDNVGPLVRTREESNGLMVCLDITYEVVKEAENEGCGMVVSHHPVIFSPLKAITNESPVCELIRCNLSAVCVHTNLDAAQGGVNDLLARRLNLQDTVVFENIGRMGRLPHPMSPEAFANLCKDQFQSAVRLADAKNPVSLVAVVGGSGGSFVRQAAEMGADCILTGDASHHDGLEAKERGISLVAAGHYETEIPVVKFLADQLKNQFPAAKVLIAKTNTNPFLWR